MSEHRYSQRIAFMAEKLRFEGGMNYQQILTYISRKLSITKQEVEESLYESEAESNEEEER